MLGIFLAMFGAIVLVFADSLKGQFGRHISYKLVIWNTVLVGVVIGAIASVLMGATITAPVYLLWLPISILLLVLGEVTFIKSLIHGDFSEVAPIRAVAPVFSLFLAMLFLGEIPSVLSMFGVMLIVGGVWAISVSDIKSGGLKLSPGVKYMICSQFFGVLLGITIKIASTGVSPLIYFTLVMVGEWIYFSFAILHGRIPPLALFRHDPVRATVMSMLWGIGILAVSIAPAYTLVSYAYASSQIYLPVSLLVSGYWLKEQKAFARLKPGAILLAGVALVILGA